VYRLTFEIHTNWDLRVSMIDKAVNAMGARKGWSVKRTTIENITSKLTNGSRSPAIEIAAA
jgi:hypothetical protein